MIVEDDYEESFILAVLVNINRRRNCQLSTYFFPDLSRCSDLLPIMTNTHMQRRINRGEDGDHPRDEVQEVLRGMHHSSEDFESLTMSEVSHWIVNGPRQPVRQHSIIQLLPNIDEF